MQLDAIPKGMPATGRRGFLYPAFVRRLGPSLYHARLADFHGVSAMSTRLEALETALQMELIEHLAQTLPPVPAATALAGRSDRQATVDGMWIAVDLAPVLERYRPSVGWAADREPRTYRPQRGRNALRLLRASQAAYTDRDTPPH